MTVETTDNLGNLVSVACGQFGSSTAVVDATEKLCYSDFAARAERVEEALRSKHVRPNEPVLVPAGNRGCDLANFVGVWLSGATVVPVAGDAPRPVFDAIQKATGARLAITRRAPLVDQIAVESQEVSEILQGAAIVIFTSGSTGQPKGVVLAHDVFVRKLAAIDEVLVFSHSTRVLLPLRITFVFGVWVALLTLKKGGQLFMQERFDAQGMPLTLEESRPSDVALVPTMLRKMLSLDPLMNANLARANTLRIITGGEPFAKELWERLHFVMPDAAVVDVYGSTETCSSDFFQVHRPEGEYSASLGRVCSGVRFRIADENGQEVRQGEIGELQIESPFIMRGYLNAPDLTRRSLMGKFFRTGDLARAAGDGAAELVGRAKDLIVRGGAKISPLELDALIAQHPLVSAALSVGIPDAILGERIHVLVVPRTGANLDESHLRQWIGDRIEKFKRPDVFHFSSELPTSSNGKVDRDALRKRIGASQP